MNLLRALGASFLGGVVVLGAVSACGGSGSHAGTGASGGGATTTSSTTSTSTTSSTSSTGSMSSSGSSSGAGSSSSSSSGTPPTCAAGERPFLVQNGCSETVWLGLTAGSLGCKTTADCPSGGATCNAGACTCNQDSDCAPLGQCSPDNHLCFWQLPTLGASQLELAQGASTTVCFPASVAGQGTQWSGNLWARTGCGAGGQGCATGECGAPSGQPCPVGHGGAPPSTLAEFTLSNQTGANPASDFYDISIINGINVAVSMTPFAGTYAAQASNPYSCGSPGSPTAASPLGGCSWQVQPTVGGVDQTTWVRDVPSGGKACTQDSDCSSGQVCGLAQNGGTFARSCGVAVGWWTADQICGTDPTFGAPINCAATVSNHDGSTSTYTNLFACNGVQAQSCYSTGASVDCCGCGTDAAGWPGVLGSGFQCANDNPSWEAHAMPWLLYLKKACPTAYTYPFDDATSTFTCQPGAATPPVAYTVKFCP